MREQDQEQDQGFADYLFRRQRAKDLEEGNHYGVEHYLAKFPECRETVLADFAEPRANSVRRIAQYEFDPNATVGSGGEGRVFRAREMLSDRVVALKVIDSRPYRGDEVMLRFQRAVGLASALQHPGVCPVYGCGQQDGKLWIAMKLYPGKTLVDALSERPTERRTAAEYRQELDYLIRIAETVQYLHENGVVHRDLKPANVLIDENNRPVLVDFGLARPVTSGRTLTATGTPQGTLHYASPEQAQGQSVAPEHRHSTDIWALGVMVYETLTGDLPFRHADQDKLIEAIAKHAPRPLTGVEIPDAQVLVDRALEKHVCDRYASAAELARDLTKLRDGEPIIAKPIGWSTKGLRRIQREPVKATLAAALAMILGLGVTVGALSDDAAYGATKRAEEQAEQLLQEGFLLLADEERQTEATAKFVKAVELDPDNEVAIVGETLAIARNANPDRALEVYDERVADLVSTAALTRLRANLLRHADRGDELTAHETGVLARPPASEAEWVVIAQEAGRAGDQSESLRAWHHAILSSGSPRALYFMQWALRASRCKDKKAARSAVTVLVQRWPGSTMARIHCGIASQIFDIEAAEVHFTEACRSGAIRAYASRGSFRYDTKNFSGAEADFSKVVELNSNDLPARYNLGVICAQTNRLDQAVQHFTEALSVDANHVLSRVYRATIYSNSKLWAKSHGDWDHLIRSGKENQRTYNNRGQARWFLGNREDAIADLRAAIAIDGKHTESFDLLGNYLPQMGENEAAKKALDRAIELGSRNANTFHTRGVVRDRLGIPGGIDDYRQAVAIDPKSSLSWAAIGKFESDNQNFDASVTAYKAAIQANPNYVTPLLNLGTVYRRMGKHEEAIRLLDRAEQAGSTFSGLYAERGLARHNLHGPSADVRTAVFRDLEQAIDKDPTARFPRFAAALVRLDYGLANAALADTAAGLQHHPDNIELAQLHAIALVELGKFADARSYTAASLQRRPKDADLWFQHGRACAGLDDKAAARESLTKALRNATFDGLRQGIQAEIEALATPEKAKETRSRSKR